MFIISETDIAILESLARYKFLTSSQMLRVGLSSDKANLHKRLIRLREQGKATIGCVKFDGYYKMKGIEFVYYLTKYGADMLVNELDHAPKSIKQPKGKVSFPRHYRHRKGCIDIQIAFYQWAEQGGHDIELYDNYFDFEGNNKRDKNMLSKTAIFYDELTENRLIADAVALCSIGNEQELFCIELHNGKDTHRAMKQIEQYITAMVEGTPSEKYNLQKANKTVFVFEYQQVMKATMQRFTKLIQTGSIDEAFKRLFLFATYESVMSDFGSSFFDCGGAVVRLD